MRFLNDGTADRFNRLSVSEMSLEQVRDMAAFAGHLLRVGPK